LIQFDAFNSMRKHLKGEKGYINFKQNRRL